MSNSNRQHDGQGKREEVAKPTVESNEGITAKAIRYPKTRK